MQRTQVYLDEHEATLLGRVAARTGASRSELIRRAIRSQYSANDPMTTRLAALRASAGAWGEHEGTGAEQVEQLRGDLNARFDRLGLE